MDWLSHITDPIALIVAVGLAIWGWYQKMQRTRAESKADELEEQIQANDAIARKDQFEAINRERAKQAERSADEKHDAYTGDIVI